MNTNGNGHALLAPGEGEVLEAAGSRLVIKIASPSQFVAEYTAPPHFAGPPLHVHPGFDETFLVIEGRLALTVRGEPAALTPGATAYVSGHVPHTFRNPAGEPARFLLICSPGGMEQYFRGIAVGDNELVAAIAERVGYRVVSDQPAEMKAPARRQSPRAGSRASAGRVGWGELQQCAVNARASRVAVRGISPI